LVRCLNKSRRRAGGSGRAMCSAGRAQHDRCGHGFSSARAVQLVEQSHRALRIAARRAGLDLLSAGREANMA
jgi:hypothetical protein